MPHNERCGKPDSIGRSYQEKGGYLIAAQQTKQERQIRFAEKGRKSQPAWMGSRLE
jgi:hypothetical protein